jgi:hypothetical protein
MWNVLYIELCDLFIFVSTNCVAKTDRFNPVFMHFNEQDKRIVEGPHFLK